MTNEQLIEAEQLVKELLAPPPEGATLRANNIARILAATIVEVRRLQAAIRPLIDYADDYNDYYPDEIPGIKGHIATARALLETAVNNNKTPV